MSAANQDDRRMAEPSQVSRLSAGASAPRSILQAASLGLLLVGMCGVASAAASKPQAVPSASESRSLQDLARQLEEERQTYRFSWPPDRWSGDDRAAVAKFLAANEQRIRNLRRELGRAHRLGENQLKSLDTARTACNVMIAAAVSARDKDAEESVQYLVEIFSAVSLLPKDAADATWRCVFIAALLPILQPGVEACGGLPQLDTLAPVLATLEKQLQAEYSNSSAAWAHGSSALISGIARLQLMETAIRIWEFERNNRRLPASLEELPSWDPKSSENDEDPPLEWSLVDNSIAVEWTLPQFPPVRLSVPLTRKKSR